MHRDEFPKLAVREIDAVYRLASHLAKSREQAEDFVQETFLRALKSGADFALTEHGVRPYLFKILHNVVFTRAARDQRQPHASELGLDTAACADADPRQDFCDLSRLNWDAVDERLKRAIDTLPLTHRTVFLLCAVENLRYREIAEIVQVPVGTVMSRLHRARQLLSAQLVDLAQENGYHDRKTPPNDGSTSAT